MFEPMRSEALKIPPFWLQAAGSAPSVILPVPGLAGRGRGGRAGMGGRGGRGTAIRTFVPQGSGAAAVAPAWMTKKASTGSPSEEASSSSRVNPFATDSNPSADPTEGPTPTYISTPSVFTPVTAQDTVTESPYASPFASAPPASASSDMLTQLSQSSVAQDSALLGAESAADESSAQSTIGAPDAGAASPMDAESAMPAEIASQSGPALFTPNPTADTVQLPTPTPMDDHPMDTQESMGRSPLDDAFGGSALDDHSFGGGNGGGGALDDTFGGGNASGSGGGLDDAFGGGNGGGGLDDSHGGAGLGGLDDTLGGALAAGDIGQVALLLCIVFFVALVASGNLLYGTGHCCGGFTTA